MGVLFTNNASTTLSAAISSTSATSISVASSSTFPAPGAGEYFYATIDDGSNIEIVKVTAVSGTTWTVVRGSDNTTAATFANGTTVQLRAAAALLTDIQQNIAAKSANQTVYNATTASSATSYDVGTNPQNENNAMVFLDGVMQHHDTFSFSGSTLTFDAAPSNGLKLEVIIDNLINLQSSNLTVDTFTATNGQTAFTLSDTPAAEDNLIVFIEGVFQNQDSYSISNNVLTMSAGVTTGRKVVVYVINPVNIGTPSDGTVTSAKLSGNITMPGTLTVGSNDVAFDSPTFVVDNANSRVGLGTASPSVPVDIVGDVKMSSTLDLTSHLDMPDNAKIKLGTGDDLEIYHDANHSYILDNGTGALKLKGDDIRLENASGNNIIKAVSNSAELYYDGSKKLETTSSGIQVAGDITKGSGEFKIKNTANGQNVGIYTTSSSSELHALKIHSGGNVEVKNGPLTVANGQSVMSTATSWGAGLTIKQTNDDESPPYLSLHKDPASGHSTLADNDYVGFINMKAEDSSGNAHTYVEMIGIATNVSHGGESSKFIIRTHDNGTEQPSAFVINGAKVGIGTSSPSTLLHTKGGSASSFIRVDNGADGHDTGFEIYQNGSRKWEIHSDDSNSDALDFRPGGVQKFTMTQSGNFGIGNTNPDGMHSMVNRLVVGSGSGNQGLSIYSGSSSEGAIGFARDIAANSDAYDGLIEYSQADRSMRFGANAGTERMRLKTGLAIGTSTDPGSGSLSVNQNLFISTTNAGPAASEAGHYFDNGGYAVHRRSAAPSLYLHRWTSTGQIAIFHYAENERGSISVDGSSTTYNTSSDERLKNVIGDAKGLEIINQLNPVYFEWKETGKKQDGLIAQEVEPLIPYAVIQSEEDGYYQMDYSKLVTPLIKAVQEQQEQIEELKAKVQALESS